jgi:hypothetical protein
MQVRNSNTSMLGLLVAGLVALMTGTYTANGGFQLAGALLLVVALIAMFKPAPG